MRYGQFCPISKANEILGEKWTILIVREVLSGARRFSEIQRGLGMISPALLTSRLKSLEANGVLAKRRIQGQKGFEYHPTKACEELTPVLLAMGEWGLCWARHNLIDDDFDVELLMTYLERSVDPDQLVGDESVIRFDFTDLVQQKSYWLLVRGSSVEVCIKDPNKDVDVYFTSTVRVLTDVWMGERSYQAAMKAGELSVQGPPALTRNISAWLRPSMFANSPRPSLADAAAAHSGG